MPTPRLPQRPPPPRWQVLGVLLLLLGLAVGAALQLASLARFLGYQSNDANLPVVLTLSLLIFVPAAWWLRRQARRRRIYTLSELLRPRRASGRRTARRGGRRGDPPA